MDNRFPDERTLRSRFNLRPSHRQDGVFELSERPGAVRGDVWRGRGGGELKGCTRGFLCERLDLIFFTRNCDITLI